MSSDRPALPLLRVPLPDSCFVPYEERRSGLPFLGVNLPYESHLVTDSRPRTPPTEAPQTKLKRQGIKLDPQYSQVTSAVR